MPSLTPLKSLLTLNPTPLYTGPSALSTPHAPLPSPIKTVLFDAWDTQNFGRSADALTDWINARWAKSGYKVSRETVCFTLRASGRDGRMGVGDEMGGVFYRGPR